MLNLERAPRPLIAARRPWIIGARIQQSYIDEKYGVEEAEKYAEWDKLMRSLFVRRQINVGSRTGAVSLR
jgi:hypothetical protein